MSRRKRVSLSIRLQPYEGSLLAEVANWLKQMEKGEANRRVEEALLMAYLPYARAAQGEDEKEIERCCWETQDRLNNHGFLMRQALRVAQPRLASGSLERAQGPDSLHSQAGMSSSPYPSTPSSSPASPPQSRLSALGHASQVSSVFGDDD